VVRQLGGTSRLKDADGLALLAAALRTNDDNRLKARYDNMLFDADTLEEVRPLVAGCSAPTAEELLERARDRYDTAHPNARQLIVAATHRPGEQLERAMWLLGLPKNVVAYGAAAAEDQAARSRKGPRDRIAAFTAVNGLLSVIASLLVAKHVWDDRRWWPDLLIGVVAVALFWTGHPLNSALPIPLLWLWAGAPIALAALCVSLGDVLLLRVQQTNALRSTGIALTAGQLRWHLRLGSSLSTLGITLQVLRRRSSRMPGQGGVA
jgi:hypothetical protein